jgi:hypothetical protein
MKPPFTSIIAALNLFCCAVAASSGNVGIAVLLGGCFVWTILWYRPSH